MNEFGLPAETTDFLKAGKQFVYDSSKCEAGPVKLKRFDELQFDEIYVNSYQSSILAADPHAGEDGYYSVRVVDLVGECEAYGAEGILVWLCDYQMFGQWDCDHWDVVIFPEATWDAIVANPARYLGAQWEAHFKFGQYLKPWDKCEFKAGRPF